MAPAPSPGEENVGPPRTGAPWRPRRERPSWLDHAVIGGAIFLAVVVAYYGVVRLTTRLAERSAWRAADGRRRAASPAPAQAPPLETPLHVRAEAAAAPSPTEKPVASVPQVEGAGPAPLPRRKAPTPPPPPR